MSSKEVYQEKESGPKYWRAIGILLTAGILIGLVLHAVDLEIVSKT